MATNEQIKEFIKLFGTLAVAECNNRIAAGKPFILPSVCMAQSALESDWGQAGIMKKANAFFGIKAGGSWTGKVYTADTWEVKDGVAYNTVANFRAYDSPAESMADYYSLTTEASRYSKALCYGADKSKWLTPRETVTALHAAGYATDELYVNKIMNTLNGRSLDEWDNLITGEGTLPETVELSFSAADLRQGTLVLADSGRSIANNYNEPTAVALNWEKAVTVEADTKFTININKEGFVLYSAILTGDTGVISPIYVVSGHTITIPAGSKYGFYLKRTDGSEINIDSVSDLKIKFISDTPFPYPGGELKPGTAIAFFIKID